jgi:hypothetical protein
MYRTHLVDLSLSFLVRSHFSAPFGFAYLERVQLRILFVIRAQHPRPIVTSRHARHGGNALVDTTYPRFGREHVDESMFFAVLEALLWNTIICKIRASIEFT